jgi:hypothetical protein
MSRDHPDQILLLKQQTKKIYQLRYIDLIKIHLRLVTTKSTGFGTSLDPDQTARMRRLVWIHAGRKRIMLVLS